MSASRGGSAAVETADPRWVTPVGLVLCVLSAVLAAVVEVALVPFYIGHVIVPVTLVLAVATGVGLPLLARRLVARTGAIAASFAPFLAWLITYFVLAAGRPEGDVLLVGTGAEGVVGLVLLGVGSCSAVATAAVVAFRAPVRLVDTVDTADTVDTVDTVDAVGPHPPAGRPAAVRSAKNRPRTGPADRRRGDSDSGSRGGASSRER